MGVNFLMTCVFLFLAGGVTSQTCDRQQAETCVRQMEDVITGVLETTAGITRTDRLQQLCLDIIKGNNLTQCFIDATSACTGGAVISPNDVIQKWEKIMQDLYNLCDGACPNFLERTVNITQCTGIIRFDALYDSSYQVFCSSLNASLQCVSQTSEQCPQFSNLFYDLLPDGMNQTASTVCTGGCDNFDSALSKLETCKKFVTDLPDDLHQACQSYENFKTCIKMSEARMTCPMFGSLMEVLYPQHIFGLYELNCNKTQQINGSTDKCGEIGLARIDHCVRIFFLAWPANPKTRVPTQQQCKDYMTGTRCLEKAGFDECASLRQYFRSKSEGKQKQTQMMQEKCPHLNEGSGHGSARRCEVALASLLILLVNIYIILRS